MKRYEKMFDRLAASKDKADEGAFVPFVTLGDPDPETSLKIVSGLVEAGADALELGIPFSDPVADGPTIQRATRRALDAGTTPSVCFELLEELRRQHPDVPIGLLVYANLVVQDSPQAFYRRAAKAGVDSVLVADIPAIESAPFASAAREEGVCPVLIATPNAPRRTLEIIARESEGYTYLVTRAGVTGAETAPDDDQYPLLATLRELEAAPSVVGFGISRPEQVRAVIEAGAAGAISGSAVVQRIEEHLGDEAAMLGALGEFVAAMKGGTLGE
ncbi:MAG: tryptophan synthase subunit alpha [Persicimonas sp.]